MDFKYCPNCQTELAKNKYIIDCKKCGFYFYFSPASSNGVIILNEKGEILLTKRKHEPGKGTWDLAGGFINFNETVEESITREIQEELHIEISNLTYFDSYTGTYESKSIVYQTLALVFTGKYTNGTITPSDDITEARFFSPENIPQSLFPPIKQAISDYLSTLH